jgi:Sap, sulfolipid-1-addressing protein
MSGEYLALAFVAALNPKLLAVDLLLAENRRPRAMFLCVLLGGLTVALTIGLLDVLVFRADAISSQKTVSAGVDLAIGLLLLAAGGLIATGRLHGRRKVAAPTGGGQPQKQAEKKGGWAQRVLAQPRLGFAMLVGAVIGIPGAAYLSALHNLITGKSQTAAQVVVVVGFVLIEFALIIVPFVFLEVRPEGTKATLRHAQDWLLAHARQLMAYIALILGAYLAVSGLIRLS